MLSAGWNCFSLPPLCCRAAAKSNPFELPIKLFSGEHQRRGPAVGTVVMVLGQMSLGQERLDFLGRQVIAKLNCRFAGNHVHQFVQQVARLWALSFGLKLLGKTMEHFSGTKVR